MTFLRFAPLALFAVLLLLPASVPASVSVSFNSLTGQLVVSTSGGSPVTMSAMAGNLLVNGASPGDGPVPASSLRSIQLSAFGDADYVLDLSGVTVAEGFTYPSLSYFIFLGSGETTLPLPEATGRIIPGGGEAFLTVPANGVLQMLLAATAGKLDVDGGGELELEIVASGSQTRSYALQGNGGALEAQIVGTAAELRSTIATRFKVTSTAAQMNFTVSDLGTAPLERVQLTLDEGNALFDASGQPAFDTFIAMGPAAAKVTARGPQGGERTIHLLDRNNNDTRTFASRPVEGGLFFVHTDFYPIGQRLSFRDFDRLEVFGFGGNDRFHFDRFPAGSGLQALVLRGGNGVNRFRVRPTAEFSIEVIGGGTHESDELAVDTRGAAASIEEEDGTGFVTVEDTQGVAFTNVFEIELFDGSLGDASLWLLTAPQ